jgi:hypothetical protein
VDTNLFTDKSEKSSISPTEPDWMVGLAVHYGDVDLSVLHERNLPLDRSGLAQKYVPIQLRHEFEWVKNPVKTR